MRLRKTLKIYSREYTKIEMMRRGVYVAIFATGAAGSAAPHARKEHATAHGLGDPLAPTNVATPKYQIWVSLFPGGNFLAKFSYKFLHRWSCTQTAQIALEYYSHTMGVWKSIY